MLRQLSIENVAVIERADIEFQRGLNVLTGETGAGKSILIDSINAILGNRTSREIVRSGAERAVIWAQFDDLSPAVQAQLADGGYPYDGSLLLYREVTADGKSICRVNSRPATAAIVREICTNLVNIHGQHDNQSLLDPTRHIDILDTFGELEKPLAEYNALYRRLVQLKHELDSLTTDDTEKERRLELLRYQADEIDKAQLTDGEEEQLEELRTRIRNSEKLAEAIGGACSLIEGNDDFEGCAASVFDASRMLQAVTQADPALEPAAAKLSEIYYTLGDLSSDLREMLSRLDFDRETADQTEERLDLIYTLKRKYGPTVADILAFADDARRQIGSIETSDERRAELAAEYKSQLTAAREKADRLTELRRAAFGRFCELILDELRFLNMPGVSLALDMQKGPLGRKGQDTLQFLISTNPGEQPKPLSRIASGGELSRIMLAIKNVLADKDEIATLIFDEIDTGVSGSGAQRIGMKLKQASQTRQIICVTHSAQIAAYADNQMLIVKSVHEGRTFTTVKTLTRPERVNELARIVSGDAVTEIALSNADEMLTLAGN